MSLSASVTLRQHFIKINLNAYHNQHFNEPTHVGRVGLQPVESDALGKFLPISGNWPEIGNQVLNHSFIHNTFKPSYHHRLRQAARCRWRFRSDD